MEKISYSLSEEDLNKIEELGAVNYSLAHISLYLSIPQTILEAWMKEEESPFYIAYHRGLLKTQFEIDLKLSQDAKTGNITAIQIRDKHKKKEEIEIAKKRILYG